MEDRDARVRDLQQQLSQLDIEARGSALTPGEAEKNRDQRDALLRDLRELDTSATPIAGARASGSGATALGDATAAPGGTGGGTGMER